ncbi:MAG: vanadium-dependent haloperoxidase [Candidatus Acidiferrum sp.]
MKFLLYTCALLAIPVPVLSAAKLPQNAVTQWNSVALQGARGAKMGAPVIARALAIVHTCMYDAWAAYDERAVGTQLGGALRRPISERTEANKERAISYAAYRALSDVLPVDTDSVYKPLMKELGYDPEDRSTDIETPTGIGNVTCGAVLEFRHHDGANQLGDMEIGGEKSAGVTRRFSGQDVGYLKVAATGPYSDWSGYVPMNTPGTVPARGPVANPDHWQPLTYTDSTGSLVLQKFAGAQWCYVTPFAMTKGEVFRSAVEPGPALFGSQEYQRQAEELIALSAGLTDEEKMIAEYWSDGPFSEQPPGHWVQFAQFVSARDHHTLDDDVKMFFALSNAMLDASIAAWDAKRAYDSVRPVTAISLLYKGKKIRSWGGPGKGVVEMDGSQWLPYQLPTFPTPPFPEYVSGHSTYSAAAARVLELWTGSDRFGDSVTLAEGSSKIEPGITPAKPVTLKWETFSGAAAEAGMSRRYGGIHFARADVAGQKLGRLVADRAWAKAQTHFNGTAKPGLVLWTTAPTPGPD